VEDKLLHSSQVLKTCLSFSQAIKRKHLEINVILSSALTHWTVLLSLKSPIENKMAHMDRSTNYAP
jgi:hypothetical protein